MNDDVRLLGSRSTDDMLMERNNALRAEVEDLRERLDAVEERARNELGLIREGEQFIQVVPEKAATDKSTQRDDGP